MLIQFSQAEKENLAKHGISTDLLSGDIEFGLRDVTIESILDGIDKLTLKGFNARFEGEGRKHGCIIPGSEIIPIQVVLEERRSAALVSGACACPKCGGSGAIEEAPLAGWKKFRRCERCNGTGEREMLSTRIGRALKIMLVKLKVVEAKTLLALYALDAALGKALQGILFKTLTRKKKGGAK